MRGREQGPFPTTPTGGPKGVSQWCWPHPTLDLNQETVSRCQAEQLPGRKGRGALLNQDKCQWCISTRTGLGTLFGIAYLKGTAIPFEGV